MSGLHRSVVSGLHRRFARLRSTQPKFVWVWDVVHCILSVLGRMHPPCKTNATVLAADVIAVPVVYSSQHVANKLPAVAERLVH